MIETFTALLVAHVLADFVLQTRWMIDHKREPGVLALHGGLVLALSTAALGAWSPWLIALAAAHVAIDAVKTLGPWRGLGPFLADQAVHLVTLAVVAVALPGLWHGGLWSAWQWLLPLYAGTAGAVVTLRAGRFAIGLLMQPWQSVDLPAGLENGGALIGLLERGLIFLLVLVGQPGGIGFLIAAKSILRFETTSKDQRAGEYVIIGTLASFGWALAAAYATLALIGALPPLAPGSEGP